MNDRSDIHEQVFGTTSNPCPTWCTLPPGHGYDSEDHAGMLRGHECEIGHLIEPSLGDVGIQVSVGVNIESLEALRVTDEGTKVEEVDPPHIVVDSNGNNMTSGHARRLAQMLLEAADRLDEVTAL